MADWHAPETLEEALALRAEHGEEATVIAGGTFLGILLNQGLLAPEAYLSLGRVSGLRSIAVRDGELRLGAMTTHTEVARHDATWPVLARAFGLVASPRVRNMATVGGVLADADYASDPPAVLTALGARAVLQGRTGVREVGMGELILGFYETCIAENELLTEVIVPAPPGPAVYRKFRSRSAEDRPCVAVAATRGADELRVVVGAVAERPQEFPDVCALYDGELDAELRAEIARRYAERIEPMDDARGSKAYRRTVTAVEVRRALEELA